MKTEKKLEKVENEKTYKLWTDTATSKIIELNKISYAGAKLVCDKYKTEIQNLDVKFD